MKVEGVGVDGERAVFGVTFGLLVGVAVLAGLVPVGGDLWFHLATGDWILAQGALPVDDPFSHTATHTLVVHGWLADVALAGTRRALGVGGLRGLQALVVLGALLAWGRLFGRLGWSRPLAAVAPFLILVLFADRLRLRPDLFSFLGFPLLLLLLDAWRRAGAVRCWPALGACLQVAVWSNVHPAVLLAPVLAGGLWLGELLFARGDDAGSSANDSERLPLAAPALLLLATCLNPYGPRLYLYAASVGGQVGAFVGEWGPSWVYFKTPSRWGHALAPWATLAAVGVGLRRAEDRSPWLPVGLVALAWGLFSARFVYLLAVPLATCLPLAWRRPRLPVRLAAALGLVALLGLVATRESALRLALREPRTAVRSGRFAYPAAEVALLETLPGPLRLWHPWDWGSWLTDQLGGQHRIFADGRLVAYGPQVLKDNLVISRWDRRPEVRAELQARAQALLDQYGVDALLVPPGFWTAGPGWRKVHASPTGEVWLRSRSP